MTAPDRRKILSPFNPHEATSTAQAAQRAGKSPRSIQGWCRRHGIGRKIGGEMHVSRVALEIFLEGDSAALADYHAGKRSPAVLQYFERCGL